MKLDLRFIIPGRDAGTVFLRPDGGLPAVAADGDDDEAAIVAVDLVLRTDLAFRAPVLETHPRRAGIPDGDPIPTLVTTEPAPAGWTPPVGLEFGPIPDALGGFPRSSSSAPPSSSTSCERGVPHPPSGHAGPGRAGTPGQAAG